MNWKRIVKFAALLLVAGVAIGFVEAGFRSESANAQLAQFLAGSLSCLVVYVALFARMAVRQPDRPFVHAALAAILSAGFSWLVVRLLPDRADGADLLAWIEWGTTLVALLVGVSLGKWFQQRQLSRAVSAL